MIRLSPHKIGLLLGVFTGLWHLGWSLLVLSGVAKALLDFVLGLHFITLSYSLEPFRLVTAAELVALTAVIGYASGALIAWVWNTLGSPKVRA